MARAVLVAVFVLQTTGCVAHYRFPLEEAKKLDGFDDAKEQQVQSVVKIAFTEGTATTFVSDKPFQLVHSKGSVIGFNSKLRLQFELNDGTVTAPTTWKRLTLIGGEVIGEPADGLVARVKLPEAAVKGVVVALPSSGRTNLLVGGIEAGLGALLLLANLAAPYSNSPDSSLIHAMLSAPGIAFLIAGAATMAIAPAFQPDADY